MYWKSIDKGYSLSHLECGGHTGTGLSVRLWGASRLTGSGQQSPGRLEGKVRVRPGVGSGAFPVHLSAH